MTATVAGMHLGIDTHANRPAANANPDGSLYSCSTHSLVYKSNFAGNSWATWATLGGTGMTDPMTTRGDIITRNASNVTDRLALGATTGMVLGKSGSDVLYVLPPGHELAYAAVTSQVSTAQTAEGSATEIVSAGAVTFDGTAVMIEFFVPYVDVQNTANAFATFFLFESTTSQGKWGIVRQQTTAEMYVPVYLKYKLTPAAGSKTYSARFTTSSGTSTVEPGAGGTGNLMNGWIRITKA